MGMKLISDVPGLIDWFADRLRKQKPQGDVPANLVILFDSLVASLRSDGYTDGVMLRKNLIRVLGKTSETVRASTRLVEFLASCDCTSFYEYEFGCDDAVSAFFSFAANQLGIDDLLMSDEEDGNLHSTPAFEKREGVVVHVTGVDSFSDTVNCLTGVC